MGRRIPCRAGGQLRKDAASIIRCLLETGLSILLHCSVAKYASLLRVSRGAAVEAGGAQGPGRGAPGT